MKKCKHKVIFPVILIMIGLIFLLQNLGIVENAFSKFWPAILIAIGVIKISNSFGND